VPVCSRHDLMGDGERFSCDAMASSAAAFLAAFDRQTVDVDEALRGWLVERATGAPGSDVLTVEEAAAYLRVHPETIKRRIRRGELKALPRGGPTVPIRIARDQLEADPQPKRRQMVKAADVIGRTPVGSVEWPT
jgi:excisionase family DNA binding protein